MIKDIFTWVLKITLQLIFWVFVLSIKINDRNLYDRAYDVIIDNELMHSIDEKATELWYNFSTSVKNSFWKAYERKKEETF